MEDKIGYTIQVEGEGLSFKKSISAGEAYAMIKAALGEDKAKVEPRVVKQIPQRKGEEAAEWMRESGAERMVDKLVALATYFREIRGKNKINRDELVEGLEEAGERVPANLARDLGWAVKAGWLAPAKGERGRYYVTNTGQEVVKAKFPREALAQTRAKKVVK